VKELFEIRENVFEMFIQQDERDIQLTKSTFEYFKLNIHLNKIIRITEYDRLNYAFIQISHSKR
jgi:hypothetical protein